MAAAATMSLSIAGSAFADGSTLVTLQDDTKRNAGVQLIYEVRVSGCSRLAGAGGGAAPHAPRGRRAGSAPRAAPRSAAPRAGRLAARSDGRLTLPRP
jgi:hypothetical protein